MRSLLALALLILGLSVPAQAATPAEPAHQGARVKITVRTVASGLDIPWDVQRLPGSGGALLVTERTSARLLVVRGGRTQSVSFPSSQVWVSGETGLMSLAVEPDFADSRRFYTCQGGTTATGHDVRVLAWTLSTDLRTATAAGTLLTGLPATSGRHGGCRLLLDRRNDSLWVGTGDAAVGTNPRNLASLGGKVLRLDPATGEPWPTNPYVRAADIRQRYVVTYGHRNVQGLAQRADGSMWSVEHGSYRDDEVNRLKPRGDYGWNPVPGYNESVPMTDQSLPGRQLPARWRSGDPTIATSGAAWVRGAAWGRLEGALAVAALAGNRLVFLTFDRAGRLQQQRTPAALRGFGRLRSVTSLPGGDLLVTTSNGGGSDRILRVSPG